jgi:hypothetical protein
MNTTEQRISELESRVEALEKKFLSAGAPVLSVNNKERTLQEIVKGKRFNNGQEQVAAIVGYNEKVLSQLIQKDQIKEEWRNAKMNGVYAPIYLARAKGTLVRVLGDGTCDLTQTGEGFFEELINN